MESFIGVILILAVAISIPIAFGKIGSNIAKNNGANASSGFWFGFWLGPIGLVISALLKPIKQSGNIETIPLFSGPESLDNDSYKIWLVRTHRIEKNDAMDSFICDDRIFSSFEEAIQHAHSIEQSGWTDNGEIESNDIRSDVESSNSEIAGDLTDFEYSEKSEVHSEPRQNTMMKSWRTEIAAKKDVLLLAAFTIAALMAVLAFWLLSPTPAEQCQKRSLEQTESCLLGAGSVEGIMACYNASNARQERCGKTRAQIRAEAEGTSPGGPVEEAPAVDAAMMPRIEASSPVEEAPAVDAVSGLPLNPSRPDEKAQATTPDAAAGTLVAPPNVRSTGSITPSRSWMIGWWSQVCEGDAAWGFRENGQWREWANSGEWSLNGDRLAITKLTRDRDTMSGGPEPISPPEVLQGRMTNIQSNSFEWLGRRMVRCD